MSKYLAQISLSLNEPDMKMEIDYVFLLNAKQVKKAAEIDRFLFKEGSTALKPLIYLIILNKLNLESSDLELRDVLLQGFGQ